MAAALWRALWAAGAIRTIAFVPGGVVHAPHVRVLPVLPNRPNGHRNGFAYNIRGQAAAPVRQAQPLASPQPPAGSHLKLVPPNPFDRASDERRALRIITEWKKEAVALEAHYLKIGARSRREIVKGAQSALELLRRRISSSPLPFYIFVLLADGETDDIQALASVSYEDAWFMDGRQARQHRTIREINELLIKPIAARPKNIATEMIAQIHTWAAINAHLGIVRPSMALKDYYKSLDLEVSNSHFPVHAYVGGSDMTDFRKKTYRLRVALHHSGS